MDCIENLLKLDKALPFIIVENILTSNGGFDDPSLTIQMIQQKADFSSDS